MYYYISWNTCEHGSLILHEAKSWPDSWNEISSSNEMKCEQWTPCVFYGWKAKNNFILQSYFAMWNFVNTPLRTGGVGQMTQIWEVKRMTEVMWTTSTNNSSTTSQRGVRGDKFRISVPEFSGRCHHHRPGHSGGKWKINWGEQGRT